MDETGGELLHLILQYLNKLQIERLTAVLLATVSPDSAHPINFNSAQKTSCHDCATQAISSAHFFISPGSGLFCLGSEIVDPDVARRQSDSEVFGCLLVRSHSSFIYNEC